MAQINKPTDYFNTVLYTGNGSTQSITGVNFQPDWVWIKGRSVVAGHNLHDVVRGVNKQLYTNTTGAEETLTTLVTSFDSDGFSLGSNGNANSNTNTFVAWNWLASNTTASNTDGSITSTVSANTTSGFSIVTWTGTGAAGTIGHSLGVAPSMIIVKNRSTSANWIIWHQSLNLTDNQFMEFNTNAQQSSGTAVWDVSEINSTNIGIGSNGDSNGSGNNLIAYCFAEKKGFSKFGSYTGNGSADGTFIYTGFKPAFAIIKRTDSTSDWVLLDNKRDSFNLMNKKLFPSNSDSEYSGQNACDFLSNGFKLRDNATNAFATNISGASYIYMCFAESPLVGTNNIPATAR